MMTIIKGQQNFKILFLLFNYIKLYYTEFEVFLHYCTFLAKYYDISDIN